jgi:hypothetical protein
MAVINRFKDGKAEPVDAVAPPERRPDLRRPYVDFLLLRKASTRTALLNVVRLDQAKGCDLGPLDQSRRPSICKKAGMAYNHP